MREVVNEGRKDEDDMSFADYEYEDGKTCSEIVVQPPSPLYQTTHNGGKQDSATPGELSIRLSPNARNALRRAGDASTRALQGKVHVAMRRFDGKDLEVFVDGEMVGLRIPQRTFDLVLDECGTRLHIRIHRKELPVSKTFGNAPFVLCVYIAGAYRPELLVSEPFKVQSKQPSPSALAKKPTAPKRVRPPPPCRPFPAPPTGLEAAINSMLARPSASAASAPSPSSAASEASTVESPSTPTLPPALPVECGAGAGAGAGAGFKSGSEGSGSGSTDVGRRRRGARSSFGKRCEDEEEWKDSECDEVEERKHSGDWGPPPYQPVTKRLRSKRYGGGGGGGTRSGSPPPESKLPEGPPYVVGAPATHDEDNAAELDALLTDLPLSFDDLSAAPPGTAGTAPGGQDWLDWALLEEAVGSCA